MLFDFAIIGFGVIGVEILQGIKKNLLNNKKRVNKKIKIAIIEKDLNNIPGGVAYSKKNSKFGFFNNPLRLSHPEFISWFNDKNNKKKLFDFAKKNPNYNLIKWIEKNRFILNKSFKNYNEIYLPRLIYSFFLEERIIDFLNCKKRLNVSIKFFKGEVNNFNNVVHYNIFSKKTFSEFSINFSNETLKKKIKKKSCYLIKSKKIIIGTGIIPPKKINEVNKIKNSNYIWDFYSSGGTNNLINKINKIFKIKKNIRLVFIGNKAGLLETMQEVEKLIKKIKIKIICISKNSLTLQKAERSKKFEFFQFKYLTKKNIKKIKKTYQILDLLNKEFKKAKIDGFYKYDVWTKTLKNKIMNSCYNQLNYHEKKKYNLITFPQIRNMTRYTYPDTVSAKNRLEKRKVLRFFKDKVIKIIKNKKNIILKTKNKKTISCDIVVNVSGPVSILENQDEIKFVTSLKRITKKFNERGFSTNKIFMLENGIYLPGTFSNNFNPGRETIIKAITKNAHKVAKNILN